MSPRPAQRGLPFLSLAQRGLPFLSLAQRGLPFPRPAQRKTVSPSAVLKTQRLTNDHPPTRSCLLHHCRLAAPLLALSPPSIRCELRGSAILQLHCGLLEPRLRIGRLSHQFHLGPPDPPRHPGPSALPSPAPPPLVGPLESSALHPPWLFPPSAPPWVAITAVAWVPSGPSSSYLLPGSSHLHHLPGLCLPAPSRVSVLLPSLLPSSQRPFLCCYCDARTRLPGGVDMDTHGLSVCVLCSM